MSLDKTIEKAIKAVELNLLAENSYVIHRKAKHAKDGIIVGVGNGSDYVKVTIDNSLDFAMYFILESADIDTSTKDELQTASYSVTCNIVFREDKFQSDNLLACINTQFYKSGIYIEGADFNAQKNLDSDWNANDDRFPYNYGALSLKCKIENVNLENCKR